MILLADHDGLDQPAGSDCADAQADRGRCLHMPEYNAFAWSETDIKDTELCAEDTTTNTAFNVRHFMDIFFKEGTFEKRYHDLQVVFFLCLARIHVFVWRDPFIRATTHARSVTGVSSETDTKDTELCAEDITRNTAFHVSQFMNTSCKEESFGKRTHERIENSGLESIAAVIPDDRNICTARR